MTKRVLLAFACASVTGFQIFLAASNGRIRASLMHGGIARIRTLYQRSLEEALRTTLASLKRAHYMEIQKIGKNFRVVLTDKGIAEVIRLRCKNAPPCARGQHIFVSFDIPERERRIRLNFRRFLQECGFTLHHKSLWVCDRDVFSLLQEFIHRAKIQRWVSSFRAYDS